MSKSNKKVAVVIPARLKSTRLPQKVLADIRGKTLIYWVAQNALEANIGDVIIAASDKEICDVFAENSKIKCVLTDPELPNGTSRVHVALQSLVAKDEVEYDYIINLQGDIPFITPKILQELTEAISKAESGVEIATPMVKIDAVGEDKNPNNVKIAIDSNSNALYFSRSLIPHNSEKIYKHIGVYAYTLAGLDKYINLPTCELEEVEKLEQLRALYYGMKIKCKLVEGNIISVDTKDDLEVARIYAEKFIAK